MNPAFEKPGFGNGQSHPESVPQQPMSPPPSFSPNQMVPSPGHGQVTYINQQPKMEQPGLQYSQQSPPMQVQQQGQYFPQQQPGQQQYMNATPVPVLGMSSAPVDCPRCGQRALTQVSYHAGNTTHAWAVGLCCFTGLFCFVPYLMNSMKDVQHRCSRCGTLLATWHKSGAVEVHAHA